MKARLDSDSIVKIADEVEEILNRYDPLTRLRVCEFLVAAIAGKMGSATNAEIVVQGVAKHVRQILAEVYSA